MESGHPGHPLFGCMVSLFRFTVGLSLLLEILITIQFLFEFIFVYDMCMCLYLYFYMCLYLLFSRNIRWQHHRILLTKPPRRGHRQLKVTHICMRVLVNKPLRNIFSQLNMLYVYLGGQNPHQHQENIFFLKLLEVFRISQIHFWHLAFKIVQSVSDLISRLFLFPARTVSLPVKIDQQFGFRL